MHRLLSILLFLLLPVISKAQFEYFNSEAFWKKLQLHAYNEQLQLMPGDTAVIVASNRLMDQSTFRYLPEKRDGGMIRYFVVYARGETWHVQPVASLEQAVALIPDKNKHWVVYTEGMGKFFTSDVDRAMNMAAQYDVNIIQLDYPSITAHKKRLGNYFFAKGNAAIAYKDFAPVLDTVKQMQTTGMLGSSGVSLFFHSMGNIVLRQIIRKNKLAGINDTRWANNLILNAPCIPQHGHAKLLNRIGFARNIYVHYNPGDFTLGGAYLVSKRYQLGKQVRKPVCPQAVYINFNTLVGEGHSNFLNLAGRNLVPEAAIQHYRALLHGEKLQLEDTTRYKPSAYRGIGYDILR